VGTRGVTVSDGRAIREEKLGGTVGGRTAYFAAHCGAAIVRDQRKPEMPDREKKTWTTQEPARQPGVKPQPDREPPPDPPPERDREKR
jgi:hypothetical protein